MCRVWQRIVLANLGGRSGVIDKSWTERIGRRQQQRLAAAFEWAIGDRQPPPGLKNPRSEEEALEAFEAVL